MKSTASRDDRSVISHRSRSAKAAEWYGEAGMTLIELIFALAIIGLIAGVTVMAVHQLLTASRQSNDQQYAVSQLRQAEHWMTRDALMSRAATPNPSEPSGFPLELSWTTSEGVSHTITYSLHDMTGSSLKKLQRLAVVDGSPSTLWLAEGIQIVDVVGSPLTWCSYARPVLTVVLTATAGTHTETRTFQTKLRSDIAT